MILSRQNSKIKFVRALLGRAKERREAGAFVVEGVRLAEEAAKADWKFRFVLHDETLSERGKALVERLRSKGADAEEVSVEVMKSVSETEAPQGILAVVDFANLPIPKQPDLILIPDQIRDPGNLGTLLRSAAAAGVKAALIPPETADAFSPKVLRAGMGAHFRLPVRETSWKEIRQIAELNSLQVLIADMDGASCWQSDLTQPTALIVGGEAGGASESARGLADGKISIPMADETESLNAGAAGSILMFEALRQRTEDEG
ncbi:MAG: RNA methyltransferase [Anaerolineales bacterium]|nr:RNA methyltransferase [Anaerolineales bacterium]